MPSSGIETIGLDLGGTKLLGGRLDAEGRVLARLQSPTSRVDADAVVAQVTAMAAALRTPATAAIGISTLSLVDRRTDALGYAGPVPVQGVRLGPLLAAASGLPVVVENDANAAAFAEGRLGAARGVASAVVVVVGTGIGAGVLLDGRLMLGARGVAGEVGRIPLMLADDPPGQPYRRFEELAAGTALDARAQAAGIADARTLVAQAEAAPGPARDLLERHASVLAAGLVACVELFDPDILVLGGGVFATGARLFDAVCARLRAEVLPPGNEVRVTRATLGADAGMVGAGLLAADHLDTSTRRTGREYRP